MRQSILWLALLLAAPLFAGEPAGEIRFRLESERRDTFKTTAEARQFAAATSAELVKLAAEQFGVTLDGSEASVVPLQRLAEAVYGQLEEQSFDSEPDPEHARWIDLIAAYYGQLYVTHHGARWGETTWSQGTFRAIGFPRKRWVIVPGLHAKLALTKKISICWHYELMMSNHDFPVIPEVKACSEQGWVKSTAELQRDADRAAASKAAEEREAQTRLTSRTQSEVLRSLNLAMIGAPSIFRKHQVKGPANVVVSFTIAPSGEVTED